MAKYISTGSSETVDSKNVYLEMLNMVTMGNRAVNTTCCDRPIYSVKKRYLVIVCSDLFKNFKSTSIYNNAWDELMNLLNLKNSTHSGHTNLRHENIF